MIGPAGSGVFFTSPLSMPSKATRVASVATPAFARRSANRTPVHSAVLTAPRSHCTPPTTGLRKTRPLPAHSSVTTFDIFGSARNCSSVSVSGCPTAPRTCSVHAATSTCGTAKWLRT